MILITIRYRIYKYFLVCFIIIIIKSLIKILNILYKYNLILYFINILI